MIERRIADWVERLPPFLVPVIIIGGPVSPALITLLVILVLHHFR